MGFNRRATQRFKNNFLGFATFLEITYEKRNALEVLKGDDSL